MIALDRNWWNRPLSELAKNIFLRIVQNFPHHFRRYILENFTECDSVLEIMYVV